MAQQTYYVVVPFGRDEDGQVVPGEAKEAPNGEMAQRRARAVAAAGTNVGALAFSRTGDPSNGEFGDATVLATFGEVDKQALAG